MFKKIKEFFIGKPVDVVAPGSAPYKVPEPAAATPIPLVVETASAPVVETTPAPVVVIIEGVGEVAIPAKAPRKPRTPKVETAVKEKAPTKAKAPKLTVVRATKSKKV